MTDADDRRKLVAAAVDRFGRSTFSSTTRAPAPAAPASRRDVDVFRSVLRLNLESAFALSQLAAVPMRERRSGSIVNISSMFGLVASIPVPDAGYVASKSGLNGLTRELAAQWGADGVRVNASRRAGF